MPRRAAAVTVAAAAAVASVSLHASCGDQSSFQVVSVLHFSSLEARRPLVYARAVEAAAWGPERRSGQCKHNVGGGRKR